MRSDVQRSWTLVPDDAKRFVLLIAGAWIAGLAIFILLGIAWPATSSNPGADRATPSSDVGVTTVGYRPAAPSLGASAAGPGSADTTLAPPVELAGHRWAPAVAPPVELAGHRWAPAVAPPVELAGHRWAPAIAPPVELAGHRWAPAIAPPVELAGHRWAPAVAPPEAMRAPSRA
jgi:hypothetical protein